MPLAYQVVAFNLLVPPDCRLLGGWKISTGGFAILPLPIGTDLENIIHHRCNELSEEDRNYPTFTSDSDILPVLLADKRLVALEAFEGPFRPALYNRANCHVWWNGWSFWEVTAALRAGLPVPVPHDFMAPRASSVPTRAASISSSRSVTSRRPSSEGMSFHALVAEVKQEAALGSSPGVKVEVKQEVPLPEVKVEVPEVKVEVKDEPPSPPHGQPPTSRSPKRAGMEATPPAPPPSPPPPEPWRAEYAVPAMYRHRNDEEWVGYTADVHLSATAAGIVIIDDDKDTDSDASADVKGKAAL
jgi:hypothetical protein